MVEILFHVVVFAVGFLIGFSSQRIAWVRSNRRLIHDLRGQGPEVTLTSDNGRQRLTTVVHSFAEPAKKGFSQPNQAQRSK